MNLLKLPERSPYVFLLFLVALISVASLNNSFLSIDDTTLIVNNPNLDFSFAEIANVFSKPLGQILDASEYKVNFIYYRPALNILYMLNAAIWGINPVGFHITNLFLHLLSAILVYKAGLILFNSDKSSSLIGAALFCVHPVHNELIGRVAMNENLFGCFTVLSLYFYLKERKKLSLAIFSLALLSKESAVMIPVVFCLIEMRNKSFKNAILSIKVYCLLLICYLAIRIFIVGISDNIMMKKHFPSTFFTACSALAEYFRLLLLPYSLNIYYPVLKVSHFVQLDFLISFFICLFIGIVVCKLRSDKLLLSLLLGTAIMLAPVIFKANEIVLGTDRAFIAERQLYVPSVFFSLFISGLLFKYVNIHSSKLILPGLYAIIFLFSFATVTSSTVWENDDTLFARFARDFPETSYYHRYKGMLLNNSGDLDGALLELNSAFLSTQYGLMTRNHGSSNDSYANKFEKYPELFKSYDINSYGAQFADIHFSIGEIYLAKGYTDRAIKKIKVSLLLQPNSMQARIRLAETYLKNGMLKEAQQEYAIIMKNKKYFSLEFV